MSTLDHLTRLSLAETATQLALHPFDLVRALVHLNALPDDLRFDRDAVDGLRQRIGLQTWFPEGRQSPATPKGLLQDLSHQLVTRGVVGETGTRLDNLSRGLDEAEKEQAMALVRGLHAAGVVQTWTEPSGLMISVVEGKEYVVADLAEGGDAPDGVLESLSPVLD